ncbi:MAG TPA: OmpA family protein [Bacteroidia bacterium]|nr:OmpA family protein [Bacteroidia bacterium]
MILSRKLIVFTVLLAGVLNAPAQEVTTSTETTQSAKVSLKSGNMPKANKFRTWDVALHGGLLIPNTDLTTTDFNASNLITQIGYGLSVSKFLTHSFAIQASFLRGKLKGDEEGTGSNSKYNFETDLNYVASVRAYFQFGNVSFLKRNPNIAFYGYLGVGAMQFSPSVFRDDSTVARNYYVQNNLIDNSVDYRETTELVYPIGVGLKYRIVKPLSLHLEYALHLSNTDKIDGWYRLLSENDNFTYVNLGLTYHIGFKDKPIQWVNPMQTIYADLYDMKDRVDMLSGDKDQDGVADMFDREPDTPEGVKVYGDGTAIDADGDGVPDWKDVEPFSPKGSQVDASGREIDTDGDGIPDSRDMEPNTAKGSLVTNTGVTIPTDPSNRGGAASILAANGYLPSIFFDLNSAVISKKYDETLASIALVMRNNPDITFEITGNCDSRASSDYNIKLGKRRAEAVKNHLIKKYGIDASRLDITSLGKNDPITKDHPMNRRVDFKVKE